MVITKATRKADMKVDELVDKYIKLRDKKASIKAEYEAKVEEYDKMLDGLESLLLNTFNETGMDSVKTASGTAYVSTRSSASVADWEAYFNGYVLPNEAWEMLERRANKTAIEQYKSANNELPPGINWTETRVINVRRPSK